MSANTSTTDTSALPHDNRGHLVIITGAITTTMALVFTSARLYTRYFIINNVGVDDVMAVGAIVMTLGMMASQSYNASHVLGRHVYDIDIPGGDLRFFLQWLWVNELFYNGAMFFIKMTLLFQYFRVFRRIQKMKWAYIGSMILVGGWCLGQLLAVVFACIPVQGFWDKSITAQCQDQKVGVYINAFGILVTDIMVLILPIPAILNLKLPKAQKVALLGIFGLGTFTSAISIVRITTLNSGNDLIYNGVESACWSITELCTGITVAAAATIRPLVSRYVPRFRSIASRGTSNNRYSPQKYGDGSTMASSKGNRPHQFSHKQQTESQADLFADNNAFELLSPPGTAKSQNDLKASGSGSGLVQNHRNIHISLGKNTSNDSLASGESFNVAYDDPNFRTKGLAERTQGSEVLGIGSPTAAVRPSVEIHVSSGGHRDSAPGIQRSNSFVIRVDREYKVHRS